MFHAIPLVLAQQDGPAGSEIPASELPAESGSQAQQGAGQSAGQTGTQQPGQPGQSVQPQGQPASPFSGITGLLVLLVPLILLFVLMSGGQRREKKKKEQMLASVAKGDRVQTVGGIIGTVVEMRDQDAVLKVDENSNTRIKFSRNAIQSVLEKE